jgi:hypothetical protein
VWAAYSSICRFSICFLQSDIPIFLRRRASPDVLMGNAYHVYGKLRCCSINISQVVAILEVCSGVRMRWRGVCRCSYYWRYLQDRATRYSDGYFFRGMYGLSYDGLSAINQFLPRLFFLASHWHLLREALQHITGRGAACSGRLDYGVSLRWFLSICSCQRQVIRIREA